MKKHIIPLALLFFLIASGCNKYYLVTERVIFAYSHELTVNSFAREDIIKKENFVILPAMDTIEINGVQFQEYAAYVKKYLEKNGYAFINDPAKAHGAIILAYGIGDPQTITYSCSIPLWTEKGYSKSSANTMFQFSYNAFNPSGAESVNKTKYQIKNNVTGYINQSIIATSYNKFVTVGAIDLDFFRENKKIKECWMTYIMSESGKNDLREIFPFLIAGVDSVIGKNTTKSVKLNVDSNDPLYAFLTGQPVKIDFIAEIDTVNTKKITINNKDIFPWENVKIEITGTDDSGAKNTYNLLFDHLSADEEKSIDLTSDILNCKKIGSIKISCDTSYGPGLSEKYLIYKPY